MIGKHNARDIRRKYADKKMSVRFSFPKLEKPVRTEEERERLVKFAQEVAAVEWVEKKPIRKNENNIDKTEDAMARRKNGTQETAEIKEEINVGVSEVEQPVTPEENTVVEAKVEIKAEDTVVEETDGLLKNMTELVEKEDDKNNRVDQGVVVGDSPVFTCNGGVLVADSRNDSVSDGNVAEEVVEAKKEEPKQKPKKRRMTYEEMWSGILY